MIDWPTIKPPLLALVKSLAGLDQCVWADQQIPMIATAQQAIGKLSLNGAETLTQKEEVHFDPVDPDDETSKLRQTARMIQRITIRIRVESIFQGDAKSAENYLERLRGMWGWWSTTEALRAVGFGFAEMQATQMLNAPKDDHVLSVAVADVRFNAGSTDTDPTLYDRIDSIGLEPTLT